MNNRQFAVLAITLLCCLLIAAGVLANGTAGLDWWVIGSAGGEASGGEVSLDTTLGQPFAGTSSGGSISLEAGFQTGAVEVTYDVYLPQVSR